jgi:hypothetical protein
MMRMRIIGLVAAISALVSADAGAQSLFVAQGEWAAEGSAAWSVGPFSQGVELHGALSLGGRLDVGFGVNRYDADFGGGADTTFTEWTPFVRYFWFKEGDDGVPVSFAGHAQYFRDDYGGEDGGWYVLAGADVFKKLPLTDGFALYPYVGFSVAGESFQFGDATADTSVYLTRQFGVHAMVALGANGWMRFTVEEHSFRRETFRAARIAYVKKL